MQVLNHLTLLNLEIRQVRAQKHYGFKYLHVIVKLIIQLSWQLVLKNLWVWGFFPVHEFQRFQLR